MNTSHSATPTTPATSTSPARLPHRARAAGVSLAGLLTLAMLLGINTLAQVDPAHNAGAQMAKAVPGAAASAGRT